MKHRVPSSDRQFLESFESGSLSPEAFNHRAHLKLAYIYLVDKSTDDAYSEMRRALHDFLARHGIDAQKYHDTLTQAWVMAVRHFMEQSSACGCADEFIELNPSMLDSRIMMTHYTAERLFSSGARDAFVEPDLHPIPSYDKPRATD